MPITRNPRAISDGALTRLLAAFEAGTQLTDGGLGYLREDFLELYEILPDAFTVTPPISRPEAVGLFRRAIRDCRHAGPLSAQSLVRRAATLLHEDLAVRPSRYTLWTKFRAQQMHAAPGFRLAWRGVSARSVTTLPRWLARDEYFLSGIGRVRPDRPHGFGHLVLHCDEREERRAVDRMLDALQLMHGLLNLYETWGRWSPFGGQDWTDGTLWLGPTQFVFRGRAFSGEDRIWTNPDFTAEAWGRNPPRMDRVTRFVPTARRALEALETHPFGEPLIRAAMLLQEGFAERDGSRRLLRYWSALEQMYVEPNDKTRSNEKVVERVMFAESEPEISRWKLEHIVRQRNDYVHAGGQGSDQHALGQFLRRLVARHLNHWIFQGRGMADQAAMLAFAKLPANRATLTRMRDALDRRLEFMDAEPDADRS